MEEKQVDVVVSRPGQMRGVKSMRNMKGFFLCLFSVMLFLMSVYSPVVFAETQTNTSYTVESGDSLYSIARDVLGDASRWQELYELNSTTISNPRLIYPGQVIDLPKSGSDKTSDEHARGIAKEYIAQAKIEEPLITAYLKEMESDTAYLEGLEHRIKSEDSLTRKILKNAPEKGISLEEAAAEIGDVLRYTLCIQDNEYVSTVDVTLNKLTEAGCTVESFKNTWGGNGYKGINTKLRTPTGYLFELQFHTPDSFEAKTEEHKNYEIRRDPGTSKEERERLEKESVELFAKVPVPEGAPEYEWNA